MMYPQQTLIQFANSMTYLLLARFVLNDLPHAAGLLNPTAPSTRLQELKRYTHTLDDIRLIATKTGTIRLYHGAPTEFAELLVERGPRVPYKVEDTARYVAKVYGLTWMEFQPYVHRRHEVRERLSTSTAPIAARWAWTFPLGEVLTDVNSHARMLVAAKGLAKEKGISVEDAYEELHQQAISLARQTGVQYTFDSAPDILGIPDKLALSQRTGALVELMVDGRAIPDNAAMEADQLLGLMKKGEISEAEVLAWWNYQYRDIRIAPGNIESARIVIRDMEPWEQDVVEEIIKQEFAAVS